MVLGIDTSARQGSIALLRSESAQGAEALTLELAMLGEGRASELLVPAIDALLARHTLEKRALSLIGVAGGPGSFTGLRVAVATAKGLAEALAIPVVAVSVPEAVSLASGAQGRVWAVLDAQRGELFYGEYVVEAGGIAERLREGIAAIDDFVSMVCSGDDHPSTATAPLKPKGGLSGPPGICTPDPSLAARLRERGATPALEVFEVRRPTAEDFARIAHRRYLSGERADVASLDANYLRRSDAEIVAARKLPR